MTIKRIIIFILKLIYHIWYLANVTMMVLFSIFLLAMADVSPHKAPNIFKAYTEVWVSAIPLLSPFAFMLTSITVYRSIPDYYRGVNYEKGLLFKMLPQ